MSAFRYARVLTTQTFLTTGSSFFGLCVAFAFLVINFPSLSATVGNFGEIESQAVYYRTRVALTYEGGPVVINFVAGCGVRLIDSRLTGKSIETMAMSAFVFGAKMPNGHAVVIRTLPQNGGFDPCLGHTTTNGKVPVNWLPLITWYERDDDFARGIGYATQDSYASSRARFQFRSAIIEHATKQEFDIFMRAGPQNLLPPYLADALQHVDAPYIKAPVSAELVANPTRAWAHTIWPFCRGVRRIHLTDDQRLIARNLWNTSRPKYWIAPGGDKTAFRILTKLQQSEKVHLFHYSYEDDSSDIQFFPISIAESLYNIKNRSPSDRYYSHIVDFGEDNNNNGFLYCDSSTPYVLEGLITGHTPTPAQRTLDVRCSIEGFVVPTAFSDCDQSRWTIFERDEYIIVSIGVFAN